MSKGNAITIFAHMSKPITSWDSAVSEAERQIQEAKDKIARLRRAITVFREFCESGEPFPGESTTQPEETS